jgi:hypothetical protein
VEPGLYFFKTMSSDTVDSGAGKRLRTGVPLNDQIEGDLEKLGWFRWDKIAGWTVKKGLEKITQAQVFFRFFELLLLLSIITHARNYSFQHVSVDDCMAQHYSSTFNAEQLVLRGNGEGADELDNFYLGTLVKDEPWVEDVEVHDRFVRIEHSEGVALMVGSPTPFKASNSENIVNF